MTNQNNANALNMELNIAEVSIPEVSEKAKENILKVMTRLITNKGEGVNGWYSKMISLYDIQAFYTRLKYNISIEEIADVVNVLIEERLVRYYNIPETNFISFGLTQLYFDLIDEEWTQRQQITLDELVTEEVESV